ncbi:MAG TPA: lysophospholipid acyltransferase family protein [Steroidobacteraceae bacterium]|nr:lysophospholipid acyltransferase family protein [Steroidobacteraceae bacterium]
MIRKPSAMLAAVALAAAHLAYATWTLLAFLAAGLTTLLLLLVLPGVTLRRAAARCAARVFLLLAGMPLTVRFAERLPPGQCVVVCNHASYLDGIVLTAALPSRFAFVIKREMAAVPLAGAVLRRLGSEFVERFNRQRGARDTRRVLRNALQGHALVFFPEGTFTPRPGLMKFHIGAFVAATRAGCPVVPAVLRGTRRALPSRGLPRPGPIVMEILAPIAPGPANSDHSAPELRDRARAAILAVLGEPDLTCCGDTDRLPDTAPARSAPESRL